MIEPNNRALECVCGTGMFSKDITKRGADLKKQFDFDTYKEFFANTGITDIEYMLVTEKCLVQ